MFGSVLPSSAEQADPETHVEYLGYVKLSHPHHRGCFPDLPPASPVQRSLASSPFKYLLKIIYLYFVYIVLPASMSVWGYQVPWNRSYSHLWATTWVLGIEPWSSERAANALNHWAISRPQALLTSGAMPRKHPAVFILIVLLQSSQPFCLILSLLFQRGQCGNWNE